MGIWNQYSFIAEIDFAGLIQTDKELQSQNSVGTVVIQKLTHFYTS